MFPAPRDTLCKLMVIRVLGKRQDLVMGLWISGRAQAHLCETVGSFSSTATLRTQKAMSKTRLTFYLVLVNEDVDC